MGEAKPGRGDKTTAGGGAVLNEKVTTGISSVVTFFHEPLTNELSTSQMLRRHINEGVMTCIGVLFCEATRK